MKCPFDVVEHWIMVDNSDDCYTCVVPTEYGGWLPNLYEGEFDVDKELEEWKFEYLNSEKWYNRNMKGYPDDTIIHTSIHTGDYYKNDDGTFEWDPCGKHKGWKSWKKENGKWVIL